MPISREELWKKLQRNEVDPVYLLFGPETELRDRAVKAITDRSFSDGDLRDFNETSFSLNTEDNLQRALAAAQQLPMMARRRVIKIFDIRISASGHRDTITEDHEPVLSAYLADPSPDSVVIFIADELNGVRKMGKFLRDRTTSVEFSPLDDDELIQQARREVKAVGAEIDDVSLRYLVSVVGQDVRRLTNEINKLATAALPGKTIRPELIEELVPHSREINNFELTDHLVAGRKTKALEVLKKILDDGGEPLMLLGLISYNYRRLLMAKDMMSRGADQAEVAKILRMPYKGQEPFLATARRAEISSLTRAIRLLAKTDLAIKTSIGGSGQSGARMQIEMLVSELALI